MKRYILPLFFLALSPFLAMCRPASNAPISRICRYDGAHAGETVKVFCTGIGHSYESALIDAQKAASWYVASKMLQTPEERDRFGSISQAYYARYNTFMNEVKPSPVPREGDDGRIVVQASIAVNRSAIVTFFKDNNVADPQEVRAQVGNPTIAVALRTDTKDDRWNAFTRSTINEFLTSRGYNVVDLDTSTSKLGQLEQRLLKIEGVSPDPRYQASLLLGADIMIEINAWNESRGGSTKGGSSVKAYETTTTRLLGSSSAFGKEYPRTNQSEFLTIKEAIQNTAERVLQHVMGYWRLDAVTGGRYNVILAGKMDGNEDMPDMLTLRLKKMEGITDFRRTTASKQRISITFKSKMDSTEMSLTLKNVLRKSEGISSVQIPLQTRKFFLIFLNHGAASTGGAVDPDKLPAGM